MECLDERWETAILKVRSQLDLIYADKFHPKPFPHHLKLTPELAIYLTELLPDDEQDGLTNEVGQDGGTINKEQYAPRQNINTKRKWEFRCKQQYQQQPKEKVEQPKFAEKLE